LQTYGAKHPISEVITAMLESAPAACTLAEHTTEDVQAMFHLLAAYMRVAWATVRFYPDRFSLPVT
jgi:hypothetical protein